MLMSVFMVVPVMFVMMAFVAFVFKARSLSRL
jgi:hypothetical protein